MIVVFVLLVSLTTFRQSGLQSLSFERDPTSLIRCVLLGSVFGVANLLDRERR